MDMFFAFKTRIILSGFDNIFKAIVIHLKMHWCLSSKDVFIKETINLRH